MKRQQKELQIRNGKRMKFTGGVWRQVCEHGRPPTNCKECGGSNVCPHGRLKGVCKHCKGKSVCVHGRLKYYCTQCRGSRICIHGIRKTICKQCHGSVICEHKRQRQQCKLCQGSQICKHNRRIQNCRECKGSQICQHGKSKHTCPECVPVEVMIESKRWCIVCLSTMLSPRRRRAGVLICAGCDPTIPDRIEKVVLPMFVDAIGFPPSAANNVVIGGASCDTDKRKPDACWIAINRQRVAFLETDEQGHVNRLASCEVAKVIDQTLSVQQEYPNAVVAHFRFNPLEFDHRAISLEERVLRVGSDIRRFLSGQDTYEWRVEVPYVLYYFYPRKSYFHIDHALVSADALQILVAKDNSFIQVNTIQDVIDSWSTTGH